MDPACDRDASENARVPYQRLSGNMGAMTPNGGKEIIENTNASRSHQYEEHSVKFEPNYQTPPPYQMLEFGDIQRDVYGYDQESAADFRASPQNQMPSLTKQLPMAYGQHRAKPKPPPDYYYDGLIDDSCHFEIDWNLNADEGYPRYVSRSTQCDDYNASLDINGPTEPVVMSQPVILPAIVSEDKPPRDYGGLALFVTICCFLPLGIVAMILSMYCFQAIQEGNMQEARMYSKYTRNVSIISIICGLAAITTGIILGCGIRI